MTSKNRLLVGIPLVFVMLLSGMTAALAHGGDLALIHACVNNSSGEIKIVGADETCKKNWSPLEWNIQGIQGDTGPIGPVGPEGPAGPQGPAGPDYPRIGFFVGGAAASQCGFNPRSTLDFDAGPFDFNDGGGWNDATNHFTLPEDGVYQFNTGLNFSNGEPGDSLSVYLTKDGSYPIQAAIVIFEDHRETMTLSITYKGVAGEQIRVVARGPENVCVDHINSSFSGALIYPTP